MEFNIIAPYMEFLHLNWYICWMIWTFHSNTDCIHQNVLLCYVGSTIANYWYIMPMLNPVFVHHWSLQSSLTQTLTIYGGENQPLLTEFIWIEPDMAQEELELGQPGRSCRAGLTSTDLDCLTIQVPPACWKLHIDWHTNRLVKGCFLFPIQLHMLDCAGHCIIACFHTTNIALQPHSILCTKRYALPLADELPDSMHFMKNLHVVELKVGLGPRNSVGT